VWWRSARQIGTLKCRKRSGARFDQAGVAHRGAGSSADRRRAEGHVPAAGRARVGAERGRGAQRCPEHSHRQWARGGRCCTRQRLTSCSGASGRLVRPFHSSLSRSTTLLRPASGYCCSSGLPSLLIQRTALAGAHQARSPSHAAHWHRSQPRHWPVLTAILVLGLVKDRTTVRGGLQ
jgi:hypothetical protein